MTKKKTMGEGGGDQPNMTEYDGGGGGQNLQFQYDVICGWPLSKLLQSEVSRARSVGGSPFAEPVICIFIGV